MTLRATLAAASAAALLLSSCTGGDDGDGGSAEDVLAAAKQTLDETSGARLDLATDAVPKGEDAVLKASGVWTRQPAFDGDLTVIVNGITFDVPVVAVDGLVYAELPFTTSLERVDPAVYGAPDPATFLDPEVGLSRWLVEVESPERGEETREGDQVVTEYTGTLPGKTVAAIVPSADGDAEFDVTFAVDEDEKLTSARVVGPFYGPDDDVDYTIKVSDYGVDKDIRRP